MFKTITLAVLLCGLTLPSFAQVASNSATAQLFEAVGANDLGKVKAALEQGADVLSKNAHDNTPADVAINKGFFDLAHFLLDRADQIKATPAQPISNGPPPLEIAPPKAVPSTPQASPTKHLFEAVWENDLGKVRASLDQGADLFSTNLIGQTPTDVAVDRGYFDLAHYLMDRAQHSKRQHVARIDPPVTLPATNVAPPQHAVPPSTPKTEVIDPRIFKTDFDPFAPKAPPKTNLTAPKHQPKAEPVVEAKVEPVVEAKVEPVVEAKAEPVVEAKAEPVVEAKAEPVVEAKAEPVVEAKTEPVDAKTSNRAPAQKPRLVAKPVPAPSPTPIAEPKAAPGPIPPPAQIAAPIFIAPFQEVASIPAPAAPTPAKSTERVMPHKDLNGALKISLGKAPPEQMPKQPKPCMTKGKIVTVCIETSAWSGDTLKHFSDLDISIYKRFGRGDRAVVGYRKNMASYIKTIFPATDFDAVTALFVNRYGTPDQREDRIVAPLGKPQQVNLVQSWYGLDAASGRETVLQIFHYDVPKNRFATLKEGAIVYKYVDEPSLFKYINPIELVRLP